MRTRGNHGPCQGRLGPARSNTPPGPASRGIMLLECLVYLSVVMLLVGLAMAAFYAGWDSHRHLQKACHDIEQVLRAGNHWRAEVRSSVGPPRLENDDAGQRMVLALPSGTVEYRFATNGVFRRDGGRTNWTRWMGSLAATSLVPESRERVMTWRWELELARRGRDKKIVPLFTFLAVQPRNDTAP